MNSDTPVILKRPDYVVFDTDGSIKELFCKVCGTSIAGMRNTVKGRHFDKTTGTWIQESVTRFQRSNLYAEMKIEFMDGSGHVTNGCATCLNKISTRGHEDEVLLALLNADMDIEQKQGNKHTRLARDRVPSHVSVVRNDGGGIS